MSSKDSINIVHWSPDQIRTSRSLPVHADTWEKHRGLIEDLYIEQDWTLKQVMLKLGKEFEFFPS